MPVAQRILIVDDEIENLNALRRELNRWAGEHAYTLDLCSDGREALTKLEQQEYGVLLTDNRMPGLSGAQLVQQVSEGYPETVSIILTGYTEKKDVEAALSAGIFSFLIKPWDRDTLRTNLERAMELHLSRSVHTQQARKMSEEVRMAAEFQQQLLTVEPPLIERGIAPSWTQISSGMSGVCGDYLDILSIDDNRYMVLLGDVSGHGLRTTFVSALLKTVLVPQLLREAKGNVVPSHMLSRLNQRLYALTERFPDLFLTFTVAIVDNNDRTVTLSSAGNPMPLHHRNHQLQSIESFGIALGVNSSAVYFDETLHLEPDAALYLFTDGIRLPGNGADRANQEMLISAILETRYAETVSATLSRLMSYLNITESDVHDDVTMIRLNTR